MQEFDAMVQSRYDYCGTDRPFFLRVYVDKTKLHSSWLKATLEEHFGDAVDVVEASPYKNW